jgi:hypothetical protein
VQACIFPVKHWFNICLFSRHTAAYRRKQSLKSFTCNWSGSARRSSRESLFGEEKEESVYDCRSGCNAIP